MTIAMKIHHRLSIEPGAYSGATADVFNVGGIAYKVFRVYGVAQPVERVKVRFESESAAYRRAAADSWLRQHTATYYGALEIDDILGEDGESVGSMYALDCCYRIELLAGDERKFLTAGLREANEHLREAERRFLETGINLRDSSVFNGEDAERFKFIDFRLENS
jgi:hypothetical protein